MVEHEYLPLPHGQGSKGPVQVDGVRGQTGQLGWLAEPQQRPGPPP